MYRLDNPPPFLVAQQIDELSRYRLALITSSGIPGAQPAGLIVRTTTAEAALFFEQMLVQAGFTPGSMGVIQLVP